MSRAYRISVRESLRRVLRASDHVSTQLELLEILPQEQMAQLLAEELERRGFERRGKNLVRTGNGVTVQIDPSSAEVKVQAEAASKVSLDAQKSSLVDRDIGTVGVEKSKESARRALREELEKKAAQQAAELQRQVTDQLEASLADIRQELSQAVNRVTAEALKKKAAQMGQIKEVTEDPQSGSMTIVLEV
jgi:hypothetical protein